MKNKSILRLYFERAAILIPIAAILAFVYIDLVYPASDLIDFRPFSNVSNTMFFMVAASVFFLTYSFVLRMRKDAEYSFVNTLPISKKRQFSIAFFVIAVTATVMVILTEGIHFAKYAEHGKALDFVRGWLAGGMVKLTALLLMVAALLWILSNVTPRPGKFIGIVAASYISIHMFGAFFTKLQQIFGLQGNHIYLTLKNHWNLLTGPLRYTKVVHGSFANKKNFEGFIQASRTYKIEMFILFEVLAIALIVLFLFFARKKYMQTDFSEDTDKILKRVPKAVVIVVSGLFFMLLAGSFFSFFTIENGVMEEIDYIGIESGKQEVWPVSGQFFLFEVLNYIGEVNLWSNCSFEYVAYQTESTILLKLLYIVVWLFGMAVGVLLSATEISVFMKRERRLQEKYEKESINGI